MNRKEFIKELAILKLNQADFALQLGISRESVYRWRYVPVYAQLIISLLKKNESFMMRFNGGEKNTGTVK